MVEYFGKFGSFIKQSIMMKPIRFGCKVWCLNTRLGYLIDFDVYQGASRRKTDYVKKFGLGAGVVLDFIDRLPKSEDDTHSAKLVCVDNNFTTYDLVDQCTERKMSIINTFQLNRVGNTTPLTDLKAMKGERPWYNRNVYEGNKRKHNCPNCMER